MLGPASTLSFYWWGHLAGTTSAPVGPWCLCSLGHLSGTPSAPVGLAASGCLDQHRLMPFVSGASTTSAPMGPWCTKVPRPIYAHACTSRGTCLVDHQHQRGLGARECLDQHRLMPCDDRGIWLAQHRNQRSRGAPRYLVESRIMLVLPGAPVWHPIGTNGALLRTDALTSIGSYLVCLGEPG